MKMLKIYLDDILQEPLTPELTPTEKAYLWRRYRLRKKGINTRYTDVDFFQKIRYKKSEQIQV